MIVLPNALISATYIALLLAILGLWASAALWMGTLVLATALGYVSGVLTGLAVLPIAILAALCFAYGSVSQKPVRKAVLTLGIIIVTLMLALHTLPGFSNFRVARDVVLTPGAAPYSLYLNFDKTVAGLLILGLVYQPLLRKWDNWISALQRAAPTLVLNIIVLIAVALLLGYLDFDPKWTAFFWIWAPVNLFFTCLAEEAFFRGFIQRELADRISITWIPVALSALLFGLAHIAGGWTYVLLATLAGLGYAVIFQRTQRIEMSILAHFALNATHFLLLTYPFSA
jgi:uncharacterized protein